ncbi:hypothetical protein [Falsigemmobacter faecalis]|uniref:hypothetical protein n=1 Tax=Falsigemmobacter faecalis TaxID=2488730 RepID=UPI001315411A|nr:hypothetical protein [Falsigemmobacter faecalis]
MDNILIFLKNDRKVRQDTNTYTAKKDVSGKDEPEKNVYGDTTAIIGLRELMRRFFKL